MNIVVNGYKTFVATGGQVFDNTKPTVVLVHGSSLDHRCWALQSRWFAFHGYSVFAPDLPGHSLSEGEPLESIEGMGSWLVEALDSVNVNSIHQEPFDSEQRGVSDRVIESQESVRSKPKSKMQSFY